MAPRRPERPFQKPWPQKNCARFATATKQRIRHTCSASKRCQRRASEVSGRRTRRWRPKRERFPSSYLLVGPCWTRSSRAREKLQVRLVAVAYKPAYAHSKPVILDASLPEWIIRTISDRFLPEAPTFAPPIACEGFEKHASDLRGNREADEEVSRIDRLRWRGSLVFRLLFTSKPTVRSGS